MESVPASDDHRLMQTTTDMPCPTIRIRTAGATSSDRYEYRPCRRSVWRVPPRAATPKVAPRDHAIDDYVHDVIEARAAGLWL
jgi:hypothetical protein